MNLKSVWDSVLIRFCIISVSAVQSSSTKLEQRFAESCFDVSVFILPRQNAKNVYLSAKIAEMIG